MCQSARGNGSLRRQLLPSHEVYHFLREKNIILNRRRKSPFAGANEITLRPQWWAFVRWTDTEAVRWSWRMAGCPDAASL